MNGLDDGEVVARGALRITLTVPKDVSSVSTHILAGSFAGCRDQLKAAIKALQDELAEMDSCPAHAAVRGPDSDNAAPAPGFHRYRSHKVVEAAEVVAAELLATGNHYLVSFTGGGLLEVHRSVFARGKPGQGDMLVRYNAGTPKEYLFWSPRDVFLDGYTRISED